MNKEEFFENLEKRVGNLSIEGVEFLQELEGFNEQEYAEVMQYAEHLHEQHGVLDTDIMERIHILGSMCECIPKEYINTYLHNLGAKDKEDIKTAMNKIINTLESMVYFNTPN